MTLLSNKLTKEVLLLCGTETSTLKRHTDNLTTPWNIKNSKSLLFLPTRKKSLKLWKTLYWLTSYHRQPDFSSDTNQSSQRFTYCPKYIKPTTTIGHLFQLAAAPLNTSLNTWMLFYNHWCSHYQQTSNTAPMPSTWLKISISIKTSNQNICSPWMWHLYALVFHTQMDWRLYRIS